MKKLTILFTFFTLLFTGCSTGKNYESNDFSQSDNKGELASFSLLSPHDKIVVDKVPSFSWESSLEGANYTLEIASTSDFLTSDPTEVYYRKDYIYATEFEIGANLAKLDVTYYWRVTAKVGLNSLVSNNVLSFFLKAPEVGEIKFPIGEKGDWKVHSEGFPGTLSVNKDDFFGTGEDSLSFSFEKEAHKTELMGWAVLTRTIELDTYGCDSVLFNFYYSGNDCKAFIRFVDNAGGYWRCPITISNNAKQTVISRFSDFSHVTRDVPYGARTFESYHIKYMEIVLENTYGDGALMLSNVKAVKRSNYDFMFLSKMNFNDYPTSTWTIENNYNFGYDVSSDGYSYTIHYSSSPNELNDTKINGYGFTKIPINKFFDSGDTLKFTVSYTGSSNGKFSFRMREEDNELWYQEESLSILKEGEEITIYAPFESFKGSSSTITTGKREFLYMLQFQFGVTGMYGTGSITYKDIEVISREKEEGIDLSPVVIKDDGMIEDFDCYVTAGEPFFKWHESSENKDEYIGLDSTYAIGNGNINAGRFTYKSDMPASEYYLPVSNFDDSYSSLSIDIKDGCVPASNYGDEVSTRVEFGIVLTNQGRLTYVLETTSRNWTRYTIPFSKLIATAGVSYEDINKYTVYAVGIALSYHYDNPQYTSLNPVYIDNFSFSKESINDVKSVILESEIVIDEDDNNTATIENFERYSSTNDMLGIWSYGNTHLYNDMSLSSEVIGSSDTNCGKFAFLGSESVNYVLPTKVSNSIKDKLKPKGITIDIKGNSSLTIYFNLYFLFSNSVSQFRKNIKVNDSNWNRYTIGFDNFNDYVSIIGSTISVANLPLLYKVTFGAIDNEGKLSKQYFYIDNIRFSKDMTRSTYEINVL